MIEKHIILEGIDLVSFYGTNNAHLQLLKALFPKMRIVARDNIIKIIGDECQTRQLEKHIKDIRNHLVKFNKITEEDIVVLIYIKTKYKLHKKDMCMIGDQIVTDILAGNRFKIKTILVDPLGEKDLKITGLNRKIESKIISKYEKKGLFKRGSYYGE